MGVKKAFLWDLGEYIFCCPFVLLLSLSWNTGREWDFLIFISPARSFLWKPRKIINKNRLSYTTCGEELQNIFKNWQSWKGLWHKPPKNFTILSIFAFLTFLTLKFKFDLVHPTQFGGARDFQFYKIFCHCHGWALSTIERAVKNLSSLSRLVGRIHQISFPIIPKIYPAVFPTKRSTRRDFSLQLRRPKKCPSQRPFWVPKKRGERVLTSFWSLFGPVFLKKILHN